MTKHRHTYTLAGLLALYFTPSTAWATACGTLAGCAAAAALDVDLRAVAVSALGCAVMLSWYELPEGADKVRARWVAIGNAIVSVCGGIMGGPFAAEVVSEYGAAFNRPLLWAFVISAFWHVAAYRWWPKLSPFVFGWLKTKTGVQ
jgi:hypothetical protein